MRSASTIAKAQTRPNTNFGGRLLRYCATSSFATVVALLIVFSLLSATSPKAQAVTNSTINFQARILQSSGALVPDGDYNVEFKIYDSVNLGASGQGVCSLDSSTDDCWWAETRTGGDTVRVVNGYVAVNLGSVTPFGASIPWDQNLYITMRVGGSGSPVWDTEMVNATTGRMKFNASPYAFQAGGLKVKSGANSTTVNFASPTATNTITFGDESGTVCIQNSASCGFATGSGTAFLQGGNSFGATANLGTTDANILNLRTDSLVRVSIGATGEVVLGSNLLTVTPSTSRVQVGSLTTDSTAINFVIDSYDQATDPSGQNGAMYYNTSTNRFRCYQDGGWVDCIGGAPYTGTTATLVGGLQNVVANQTALPIENMVFTTNTAVSTVGASGGFTAPADGSFRSCLVQNTANITAGTLSLRWRVNGVSVGSVACLMDNTAPNNREVSEVLNPGSVTFQAGDIIDVAFDTSATFAPTGSNDFTVYWGVEYIAGGGGSGSGGVTLQDVYDQSLVSELTTANNKDITFNLANTAIDSNFVVNVEAGSSSRFVLQNAGADTFSVNATGDVTASGGLTVGNSSSTTAGTIRWTGTDFEGFDGSSWVSLTSGSGGSGIGQNMVSRVKQANESVISNIVPQDDNELTFPIGPNEEWSYRFVVQANAAAAADMRFAVTAPVGAVCNTATSEAENGASDAQVGCGVSSAILNGSGAPELYEITGRVINGVTPGNITLQWAQFTSNATNTIVYAGSYVQATRSIGAGGSGQPFAQSGNAFGATAVLGTSDNNALSIITNGTEKIRIDASGNIGIGDGTPVALFTVGTADAFQIDASGNVLTSGTLSVAGTTTLTGNLLAGNTATLTTGTTTGTGTATTTLNLTADAFAVNDVVLIDNVGQDYYTRITVDPGTGSYTVSPAITFEDTVTVTKYNIQNVGASSTDYTTTANRFFQGYFLGGITVGAGSTTLADGLLQRTTGDIVINPGAGGVLNVNGAINATSITGDGSGLTSIDSSAISGATITGIDASNISAGSLSDARLSANVALLNSSPTFTGTVTASDFVGGGSGLTAINGSNIASGTVADARLSTNIVQLSGTQTFSGAKTFGAGLTIGASQTITIDGQGFSKLDGTGLTNSAGSLSVSYGSSAGTAVQGNTGITITAGNGLSGGGSITLGAGGTVSLDVAYGSLANTAVQGNTLLTCPSGSGNLSGGGTSITLGTGGTCGAITTNNAVSFTTSVTSPSITSTGAIALTSGGANTVTIDAGGSAGVSIAGTSASSLTLGRVGSTTTINGSTVVLGTSTVSRTASGATNFEFNDTADTSVNFTNTDGTAVVNMVIEGSISASSVAGSGSGLTALDATNVGSGTLNDSRLSSNVATLGGAQSFSGTKTFDAGAVVTAGQTITINSDAFTDLTGTGLTISSGSLGIDTTYFNANYLQLGSASIQTDASANSTLGVNKTNATGNLITLQRSGVSAFTVANSGALQIRATSTAGLDVQTGAGVSVFRIDTSGSIVRVGQSTADATGVVFVLDTKNTNGDPTGENGAQYYNSARGTFRCYENGRGWTDCLGVAKPNTRRSTQFLASGSVATLTSSGGDIATVSGTGTAIAATTVIPASVNYATAAGANSDTGVVGNTNYNTSANPSMQANVRLLSTASTRNWVGFTNQTLATMNGAANPAGIYAAFRYDTSALDANWQCITKNGGAQTINNSGVAASTTNVEMEIIIVNGTRVEFKINGVLVCSNIANLPAGATMMRYVISRRNLVAGAQSLQVSWLYLDSDQ